MFFWSTVVLSWPCSSTVSFLTVCGIFKVSFWMGGAKQAKDKGCENVDDLAFGESDLRSLLVRHAACSSQGVNMRIRWREGR